MSFPKMVGPDTFNDDTQVIELFNSVIPDTFKLLTFKVVGFVKLLIDVFKLLIAVLLAYVLIMKLILYLSSLFVLYDH